MTDQVLGLDLSKVGLAQALEAMIEAWLDAQKTESVAAELLPIVNHCDPIRLSYWWETRSISRATAFRLVKLAQIEPGKMRIPTSRVPVSCLTAEQVTKLDALAASIKSGKTLQQLEEQSE